MTRVNVAATRCAAKRVASAFAGGLFAILLAACETGSSQSGAEITQALTTPQPQSAPAIAFAPIIGAPTAVSSKLDELLVASVKEKNVPLTASSEAQYVIRGFFSAAPDAQGTKVVYIWDVTDKTGKRAHRFQAEERVDSRKSGDPWSNVDDQILQKIAATTADRLAEWLSSQQPAGAPPVTAAPSDQPGAAAAPSPRTAATTQGSAAPTSQQTTGAAPAPTEVIASVVPVSGAPGDGSESLTAAMKKHLGQQGIKLADSGIEATYTVRGTVEMGAVEGGQQPITIRWTVQDRSGKTLDKTVVQRNKVPQGSLDGPWGQVADLAAGEAAKSVARLLPKPTS